MTSSEYKYLLPVFVGHPFFASYTEDIREAVTQACMALNSEQDSAGHERHLWKPEFLSEKRNTQLETVYAAVFNAIKESAICIFEISGGTNVNVFFELGLAIGMNRTPVLFSHTSFKNVPSDIQGIIGFEYTGRDDLVLKVRHLLLKRLRELKSPPVTQTIIHQKMQIDANWQYHIKHASQGLYFIAGDLSWASEYGEAINTACRRGVTVQICCRRPKAFEEQKWRNIAHLRNSGAYIRLYPSNLDPKIRGLIVEPEKLDQSTEVMLVEKRTRASRSQDYERTGITIGESKYLYEGHIYRGDTQQRHVTAFVNLFERLWENPNVESYT